MSKLIANVDEYDIEEIEKKMELMSSECASRLGDPDEYTAVTIGELKEKLNNVSDSYPEFVRGILEDCEYYKYKNPHIAEEVLQYIDENPKADTSNVLDFETNCIGIPWGDENGKWYRWDKEITEEEAKRITQNEYCDD